MFLDLLAQAADEKCRLAKKMPILVGVSGGADSLALLLGLHTLGYSLIVAHLDHGLREESAQDADFVHDLAEQLELPFVSDRVDVEMLAEEETLSIEEAAREVRYRFLFEQAQQFRAQAVAVGHHADDQVETILMHFLRGAALSGLSGMPFRRVMPQWHDSIPLVRPLLGISRQEIEDYLVNEDIAPRVDQTNQDTTYFRNRLRHELIPNLETYNPQIKQVLWRMGQVLEEEDALLTGSAQDAWSVCFRLQKHDRVELARSTFLELPVALQRRVLRQAIDLLRPDLRDVGFDAVARGLAFITQPSQRGEIDLVAQLNLAVVGDVLIVKDWNAELPDFGKPLLAKANMVLKLNPGDSVPLMHEWCITAEVISEIPADLPNCFASMPPEETWLDMDSLALPLTVRGRNAGERWQPFGMKKGRQTLQDFFINQKVPAHLRDRWPLVCSGEAIAWVAGIRPSEAFRITEKTQRILRLRLMKEEQCKNDIAEDGARPGGRVCMKPVMD